MLQDVSSKDQLDAQKKCPHIQHTTPSRKGQKSDLTKNVQNDQNDQIAGSIQFGE